MWVVTRCPIIWTPDATLPAATGAYVDRVLNENDALVTIDASRLHNAALNGDGSLVTKLLEDGVHPDRIVREG